VKNPAGPGTEPYRALTLKAKGRMGMIALQVRITKPDQEEPAVEARTIWSIAAPRSQISTAVANALGLEVQAKDGVDYCQVDIHLPNHIRCAGVQVSVHEKAAIFEQDCIIGMDIISLGDMSMTHVGGNTQFSFRIPALGGIDYVEEHAILTGGAPVSPGNSPGTAPGVPARRARHVVPATRDQPCPCGSGKKHKNCCGRYNRPKGRRSRK